MTHIKTRIFVVLAMVVAALVLVGSVAMAKKPDDGTRPGWGFGDENHTHTGPPGGPSVHPVHSSP